MKKSELVFSAFLVPVDALMLFAAGLFAYQLRFNNAWIVGLRPVLSTIDPDTYLGALLVVAVFGVVVFAFGGLYAMTSTRSAREELTKVAFSCATLLVVVILFLFFSRQVFLSRFLILGFLLFSVSFVFFGRVLVRFIQRLFFRKGIGTHRVVIVGEGETADELTREFAWHPELGYRVIERIKNPESGIGKHLEDLHRLYVVDEVLLADSGVQEKVWAEILGFVDAFQRTLRYAADIGQRRQTRREMSMVGTIPVVEFKRTRLEGWGRVAKRAFDVVGSLLLLVFLSPLMALAAFLIRLDSRGPIFFRTDDSDQPVKRVGEGGRSFPHLKFRTMFPGTHTLRYTTLAASNTRADGPLVKVKNDPRITRVGRLLRRYSIDELPELFLVLSGSMSLVGPRPHFPEEVARYGSSDRRVFTVKPGMTGLAQISGRSDLAFAEELRLDLYYIENWSFLLDLGILLKTPWVVLRGKAV